MSTFECGICFHQYNDGDMTPRILTSCGHTICQQCAIKLTDANFRITCPFDRKDTQLNRNEGVNGLLKNFALLDLSRDENTEQEGSLGVEADVPCFENSSHEAVFYCQQCEVDLCDSCFTSVHKSKTHSTHQKINISEKPFKLPKCPNHPHNIAEFLCTEPDCTSPTKIMCQICLHSDQHTYHKRKEDHTCENATKCDSCAVYYRHNPHKYDFLMDKLIENEQCLKKAEEAQKMLQETAEIVIEAFNQSLESYEVTGEAFQNAVESISDHFDMKKKEAICKLTKFAKKMKEEQTALRSKTEEQCRELKELEKLIEKLKKTKDLHIKDKIDDWFEKIKPLAESQYDPHSLNDHKFIVSDMKLHIKKKSDAPIPPILQKFKTDMELKYPELMNKYK
ncbi:unnamed protein product [Caenorhabditis brenneri]